MNLVYDNERKLFKLMLAWSLLVWGAVLVLTVGLALVYALFAFLLYCFVQSALISYIKGNGVRITEEQFPDLKRQIAGCCRKLGLDEEPQAYLLQMGGMLNAFATRFLGRDFLVLYSDVVDGLADNPDALNFYIGHEIGHIKRKHLHWATVLMPATALPLIGAAYARAREYTCDRHGLAACDDPRNAEHGLAVLAAGGKRARAMNHRAYVEQARQTEGFWMSFHELVNDYPWLVKRMAAVRALAAGHELRQPARNKLAGLLALCVPRMGVGGGAGAVVPVFVIALFAAVAIPAYKGYQQRAQQQAIVQAMQDVDTALAAADAAERTAQEEGTQEEGTQGEAAPADAVTPRGRASIPSAR
ncbi:M48 family metallopeptidase [Massilia forsythiae]|uniref:M48 family metallopeptidase n=1 Tax=Massilia forsythiae TaxID=2728020 RepID=A0A7Z2VV74_9BURK|nr:M48 family metallopeptidase [Massilia forsythiae]QJD99717.1 M48 family metallopeptidase [Massilia forsythiae]